MASHVWCGLSATYLAQTSYIFRPLNEAPYLIHIGYLYLMCQICVRIFDTYMVHCLIKFDIRWVCTCSIISGLSQTCHVSHKYRLTRDNIISGLTIRYRLHRRHKAIIAVYYCNIHAHDVALSVNMREVCCCTRIAESACE